jgi:hypothetical protein
VTAEISNPAGSPDIKIENAGIDGRTDSEDWTITILNSGTSLIAGDVITYTLGDQTFGGKGAAPSITALETNVSVSVDIEGNGSYEEIESQPQISIISNPPSRLVSYAPSNVAVGKPFQIFVTAQDTFSNRSEEYNNTVHFESTDNQAVLPMPYTYTEEDLGTRIFTATFNTPGLHWIHVYDEILAQEGISTNPISVEVDSTNQNIYWGDLHYHTEFSLDACCPIEQAIIRVRDELGHNFTAVTDHISTPENGLTLNEWEETRDVVNSNLSPGAFIPILAYEWSKPAPYGHHNVYFQEDNGFLCYTNLCRTFDDLCDSLDLEKTIIIPHHTGIKWGELEHTVDWSYKNPLRTSIEIFSGHGQSEKYDPEHLLSYDNRNGGIATSVNGPHYARDAWAAGQKIGVLAATDDHQLLPGRNSTGLTAIIAESLDRDSLFNAIRARHTYGTTGPRIFIDFRLGNAIMGDVVWIPPPEFPTFNVTIAGTAQLDWVELVKYNGIDYTVVYSSTTQGMLDTKQITFDYKDENFQNNSFYYVRVQQPDLFRPDRVAMAWTSPIWVERGVLFLPNVILD